jgi:hypothetical protein
MFGIRPLVEEGLVGDFGETPPRRPSFTLDHSVVCASSVFAHERFRL